jgi:hypothetical protein
MRSEGVLAVATQVGGPLTRSVASDQSFVRGQRANIVGQHGGVDELGKGVDECFLRKERHEMICTRGEKEVVDELGTGYSGQFWEKPRAEGQDCSRCGWVRGTAAGARENGAPLS